VELTDSFHFVYLAYPAAYRAAVAVFASFFIPMINV
jgi:hypothetical protein